MLYLLLTASLLLAPYQIGRGRVSRPEHRTVRQDVITPVPGPICFILVNEAGEIYDTCP